MRRYARNGPLCNLRTTITKTYLYNFDPLKPHFYIVKLGFTGYIGGSNEYPQSMFWAEIWKLPEFFFWMFSLFGGKILNIFEQACFLNDSPDHHAFPCCLIWTFSVRRQTRAAIHSVSWQRRPWSACALSASCKGAFSGVAHHVEIMFASL